MLKHGVKISEGIIQIVSDTVIDNLVDKITKAEGKNIPAYVSFNTQKDEQVLVKVGIPAVSVEGVRKNLEAKKPDGVFLKSKTEQKKSGTNTSLKLK